MPCATPAARVIPISLAVTLSASLLSAGLLGASQDVAAPSSTQPAAATTAPQLSADADLDAVLAALDRRGGTLRSLSAGVELADEDPLRGAVIRRGTMTLLRDPETRESRVLVRFDEVDDGDRIKLETNEFLLDGEWLTERDYAARKQTRRQLLAPGSPPIDLLKLGEGPFPLPIGQSPDDVRATFDVTRLPDDAEQPGTIVVELRPKQGTELASKFQSITVWIDPTLSMPVLIQTVDADENLPKVITTRLTDVQLDTLPPDAPLDTPPTDLDDWDQVTVPYGQ